MTMEAIAFWALAGGVLAATAFLAAARKVVQALFAFFFLLFCVAGLFVLLRADFLAPAQIIVYVGGILVLLLFGVMLTGRSYLADGVPVSRLKQIVPAFLVCATLGGGIAWAFRNVNLEPAVPGPQLNTPNAEAIGASLLTDYALLFELASLLLLAALVGAAYLARKEKVLNPDSRNP